MGDPTIQLPIMVPDIAAGSRFVAQLFPGSERAF